MIDSTSTGRARAARRPISRRLAWLAFFAATFAFGAVKGFRHDTDSRSVTAPVLRIAFESGLDSLDAALGRLGEALDQGSPRAAVPAFREARASYKRIETLLEVFGPAAVEALNGPAAEASEDRPYLSLGAPAGFQVIEGALFHGDDPGHDSLIATAHAMRRQVVSLRRMTGRVSVSDANLLDALRLEIARIATLGVAGFDAPASGDAIVESAASLEGARALVEAARAGSVSRGGHATLPWDSVDFALARAARYLRAHPSFDSLNRLAFIAGYANPAARVVADARRSLAPPPSLRRAWRQDAATVFERGAFDAYAYAPVDAERASTELVALGRRLFFDPKLSGPRTRSCAFCHEPERAFTDGRARSALLTHPHPMRPHRNTPTLINAAYSPAFFDDLRARSLEMQAGMVLGDTAEMGGSAELAAARLRKDSSYGAAFARAFPDGPNRAITSRAVRLALAAYVRSLSALDSRFDRAVRGDTSALSATERFGFTVFMGKGRCGSCHFLPLFNGTMPPDFVSAEAEVIGTTERPAARHARLDPDPGIAGVDFQPVHRAAFKVPTLRNIALTAPYMHNGVFATLEEVVDFYDRGGGAGSGIDVPNQTLSADSLHLSPVEKRALVEFMRALSDTSIVAPGAIPAIVEADASPSIGGGSRLRSLNRSAERPPD